MTTETNQDESSQPPFQFGDVVRHQSGDVIKVEACKRVVAHSHLRWAVYDANGNRFWARNCGLVERPRATLGGGTAGGDRPIVTPFTAAQRAGVDELPIRVKGAADFIADADLEPGTINDQGEFVGISEITGAAVHATQLKTDVEKLLVASIAATLARVVKFYNGDNVGLRDEFRSVLLKELAEHRSPEVAELKAEIETLAKQRDEAREELKEATAEFVRALAIANRERDEANLVAKSNLLKLSEWQAVVVRCEQLLKMNGPPCEHPASSAVPLQLDHCLKSLALAENVIRDASKVLARKAT